MFRSLFDMERPVWKWIGRIPKQTVIPGLQELQTGDFLTYKTQTTDRKAHSAVTVGGSLVRKMKQLEE